MSQRSSRSRKSRPRSGQVNKPELRTSKGGKDRSAETASPRPAPSGPRVKVRPEGTRGLVILTIGAWLVAALPLVGGWLLGQWAAFSYPDSLWLYIAIGTLVATAPVGYVARRSSDVDYWVLQGSLIALGALGAEAVLGPGCPAGGDCGVIGARGAYGILVSVAIVLMLGLVARWLGLWLLEWASERRPRAGHSAATTTVWTMVLVGLFVGVPVGFTLVAADALLRDEPRLGREAEEIVGRYCFGIAEPVPALDVRAAPRGLQPAWSSFLVRRADESRQGIKDHPIPDNIVTAPNATPYEAAVSFGPDGEPVDLQCRRVAPAAGTATAYDYAEPVLTPADNPLDDMPSQFGSGDNGWLDDPNAAAAPGAPPIG